MSLAQRRLRRAAVGAGVLAAALGAVLVDAAARRERLHGPQAARARAAAVRLAGVADLALSSSSRWLRHPSQVELAAAVQDGPASLDVDPAGLVLGPPLPPRRTPPAAARGRSRRNAPAASSGGAP
jgi:hypothetical protein